MNLRFLFLHQNLLLLPLFRQNPYLSRQHRLRPRHLLLRILLPRYSNNNNPLCLKLQRNLRRHHKLPSRIIQYLPPSLSPYNPLKLRLLMLLLRLLHFSSLPSNRHLLIIIIIISNLKLCNINNNPINNFISNRHTFNTCLNRYNSLMLRTIRMPSLVSPLILIHRNKHNTQLHNKLCRVVPTRITSDRRKLCQIPLISIPLPLLPHNHKKVLMVRSVSWVLRDNTNQVPMPHSEVPTMDILKTSV